jgi:hypothetical protein
MAGHRHASDRSRRHQKNRQPLIGLNRIIRLASRRASVADIEQSPAAHGYRRIVLAGWLASRLVSYPGVLWCFLYRPTPAQDQRQGLAFRVHRQICDLNWNPPCKPQTLHGIPSLTARQANPADLLTGNRVDNIEAEARQMLGRLPAHSALPPGDLAPAIAARRLDQHALPGFYRPLA